MLLQFKTDADTNKADYVNIRRKNVLLELNLNKKRYDPIEIDVSDDLAKILRQSYELYPRKYLFTDARLYPNFSKKLKQDTVAERLHKIFLSYGKNILSCIMRASYVSWRFEKANHQLKASEINKMARLMRTSAQYINTSYKENRH